MENKKLSKIEQLRQRKLNIPVGSAVYQTGLTLGTFVLVRIAFLALSALVVTIGFFLVEDQVVYAGFALAAFVVFNFLVGVILRPFVNRMLKKFKNEVDKSKRG